MGTDTFLFIMDRDTCDYRCMDIDGTYHDQEAAIAAVFSKLNPLIPDVLETIPLSTMIDELESKGIKVGFVKWIVFGVGVNNSDRK